MSRWQAGCNLKHPDDANRLPLSTSAQAAGAAPEPVTPTALSWSQVACRFGDTQGA